MIALNIFVICVLAATATSQTAPLAENYGPYQINVNNYINVNRRQYAANIVRYNLQIQTFKDLYLERIDAITNYKDLLTNSLPKYDGRRKDCVDKYKSLLPTVTEVNYQMDKCLSSATSQLAYLIQSPSSTNTTLQYYYTNTFEKAIATCQWMYSNDEKSYTTCAQNAVSSANVYTLNNQKTFASQLASSYSSSDAYVFTAMECSYTELNRTISLNAQYNTMVDKCVQGLDNCYNRPGYYCEDIQYIPSYEVSTTKQTMNNVFYGRNQSIKCLMLQVY